MLLPTSDGGLSPNGTFWLFTVITIIGGVWAWVFIPETAQLSLEQMDYLFRLPWYKIGTSGRKAADVEVEAEATRWEGIVEEKVRSASQVENVQVERKV
jgi:hypothetical protein